MADEEMFTVEQFVPVVRPRPHKPFRPQFNPEKLRWLNHQYLRQRPDADLANLVAPRIERAGGSWLEGRSCPRRRAAQGAFRNAPGARRRGDDVYGEPGVTAWLVTDEARPALAELTAAFAALGDWRRNRS